MKKKVFQKKREQKVSKQTKWTKIIFFNKTLKFILKSIIGGIRFNRTWSWIRFDNQ